MRLVSLSCALRLCVAQRRPCPRAPVSRGCGRAVGDDEPVRKQASILHLDLDAFFAAVEQRDKPSLRGKPVIVGGVGGRGVVATASYEARKFGVRSAMSTAEARSRCPHAAFLVGRFDAYRASSRQVMAALRDALPADRAAVARRGVRRPRRQPARPRPLARRPGRRSPPSSRQAVDDATGGLTASVGIATSKLVAKIASELDKPDGARIIAARHRARPAAPDAGHRDPRRRPGDRRAAAADRRAHRRRARADQRSTS